MNYTIFNEDCLSKMKELPAHSIDMILCDLPYGTTALKWDSVLPLDKLWECYWHVIKPNGAIVLFGNTPFTEMLGASQIQYLKYKWIWLKPGVTGVLNSKKMPLKNNEDVLVFYKDLPVYNPQNLQPYGKTKKNAKSRLNENFIEESAIISGGFNKSEYKQAFTNHPRLTIETLNLTQDGYNERHVGSNGSAIMATLDRKLEGNQHPTQKPISLLSYLIKTYTNPGETVLDNTMGSGSTGVAALQSGRHFIGIEKDKEYYDIAKKRLSSVKKS